jgi:hypothetical protein
LQVDFIAPGHEGRYLVSIHGFISGAEKFPQDKNILREGKPCFSLRDLFYKRANARG